MKKRNCSVHVFRRVVPSLLLTSVLLWGSLGSVSGADWGQFRGGTALSVARQTKLEKLAAGQGEIVWRQEIPGSGWAQPVVVDNKIFVVTAIDPEGRRPKGMAGGVMDLSTLGRGPKPQTDFKWQLLCLAEESGEIIWTTDLATGKPPYGAHASNTFATETPAASKDAVYTFIGPLGVLVATDHSGKELWRHEFGPQVIGNQFGTGSSPLLVDDALVLQLFNEEYARIVCLNPADGSVRWQGEQRKGSAWSTPILWNNEGTREVIGAGQGTVVAYDLATGAQRWQLTGLDTSFSCSVVADAEGLYFGTSSPGSRAPMFAIRPGHLGDLTLAEGATTSDAIAWSRVKSGAGMPSPVLVHDRLYFFGNAVVCYDKRSGEEIFRKRLPGGTLVAGCPVVVDDRIYVVNEAGKVIAISTGEQFEVVAEFQVGSADEVFWATPAAASNGLLVRSSGAIYCVR